MSCATRLFKFFTLTILINKRRGFQEIPFESESYRMPKRSQ